MDSATVVQQIREAFPASPLPTMTLHQGQLADQSLSRDISEAEWNAEGDKDRSIPWPAFEAQDLVNCDAALSHLDEEGFAYYLPAFLTFALRNFDSSSFAYGGVVNAAVHAVTELSNYNIARLKRLSGGQIEAVISFLLYIRENDKGTVYRDLATKALKEYWQTPYARTSGLIQAQAP